MAIDVTWYPIYLKVTYLVRWISGLDCGGGGVDREGVATIMHHGVIVVAGSQVVDVASNGEVALSTWRDVVEVDGDVVVTIATALGVVEAQGVGELVLQFIQVITPLPLTLTYHDSGIGGKAAVFERKSLRTTNAADIRRASSNDRS